jgi:hypothetical protein
LNLVEISLITKAKEINTKISGHLNYFFLNITRKIHLIDMHVYVVDGEVIVHRISTPLVPRLSNLKKRKKIVKKIFW